MNQKQIHIQYFASLREERGLRAETYSTHAATARALFDELNTLYGFTLDPSRLRVAVNEEFSDWDATVNDGDTVVFIPPVAGG